MPVLDACDILDGIARALGAAHAKEIVHRDLKPDNVFLHQVENGPVMVKLLDFGIAKLVRATPGTEKTETGNMLGTPRYISPEQARGINVDHRADIYSLGVMAYEVLAGRPPFQGETAMDLVVQHLSDDPPPLSQFARVPRPLEQCVMRMLEKDPARRPTLDDIRSILIDPTKRTTPAPGRMSTLSGAMPMMTGQGGRTRPRWVVPLVAGASALVIAAVAWRLVSGEAPDAPSPAPVVAPAVTPPPSPPAPVPAPPPALGTLAITVTGASEATISIDGTQRGKGTQVETKIEPGPHVVEVVAPNRPPATQTVTIAPGGASSLTIVIEPPPPTTTHPPTAPSVPPATTRPPPTRPPTTRPAHHDDDDALIRPRHS